MTSFVLYSLKGRVDSGLSLCKLSEILGEKIKCVLQWAQNENLNIKINYLNKNKAEKARGVFDNPAALSFMSKNELNELGVESIREIDIFDESAVIDAIQEIVSVISNLNDNEEFKFRYWSSNDASFNIESVIKNVNNTYSERLIFVSSENHFQSRNDFITHITRNFPEVEFAPE